MSSKTVQRLRREGYISTGLVLNAYRHEKAEVEEKAKAYRVLGNKVKVVLDSETTEFRDRKETNQYWRVMYLPTEAYKADQQAKLEARQKANHESELMKIASELSMDDVLFILKFKTSGMAPYPMGALAYYAGEELVKVWANNPASNGRKGYDYRVEFLDGHSAWVHEGELVFEDENGNPVKPE